MKYKRILLKLSGETFAGGDGFGLEPKFILSLAKEIKKVFESGVEVGVVIGAGNIFRGKELAAEGVEKTTADYIGMLGTTINSLMLQDRLEQVDVPTRLMMSLPIDTISEPFIKNRALRHFEKGRVLIFAGGTGNPFFTTDTAALLKAAEIKADVVLKATKVDGVYDKDPVKYPDAVRYNAITFDEVQKQNLQVMDQTAITMAEENNIPIVVFNLLEPGNIVRVVSGEDIGTYVGG